MNSKVKHSRRLFLPLLTLLGFALRLYRIDYQSVWWDEAFSAHVAEIGPVAVLNLPGTIAWNHPPLHFGLLTGWAYLAGFSEFSLRYLSLLFGVLLLPVVYRVTRRLFDRPSALVAMGLIAVAPLFIVYSQVARVYALLPLLYLLLLCILHRLTETDAPASRRLWLGLAVVETLILYSHFIAALGVLYANLYLLAVWFRRRFSLRAWLASQSLVVALFAPWLWNMARNWDYVWSQIGVREWQAAPPNLIVFLQSIWRFAVSGSQSAVEGHALLPTATALLALIAASALLLAIWADGRRHKTVTMLAHGLVPLAFCFFLWQVWPQAQPRYMLPFAIPLFFVLARMLMVLLTGHAGCRLAGALLAGGLTLNFGLALQGHYFDERFHEEDARGVAAYLVEVTTADDVILVGPDDYSVPYYYAGSATIEMARDEPRQAKVQHLAEITAGRQRLFLVHWKKSKADLHGLRPFLLERVGRMEECREFRGLDVCAYTLGSSTGSLPDLTEAQVRFEPLLLTGVFYEPTVTTDGAVAVALRWRLLEPADVPYKAVVTLADATGRRLSSNDVLLLDDAGQPTHLWPLGTETVNFYVVPVPVGTPPLSYRLAVSVYAADTLGWATLGEMALVPGRHFDRDPYGTWQDVAWEVPGQIAVAEGLVLERFAVLPRQALPGGQVRVLLRWRAEGTMRSAVAPLLRLSSKDQVWAEIESSLLAEIYPPNRWAAGEVVVERHELAFPPWRDPADLTLILGERCISLGQVQLDAAALLWEPPPMGRAVGVRFGDFAELLGYDLEATELTAGRPFRLTLYWRALNNAPLVTSYTVFTQLLAADGRLIAQHDGPPVENTRPTTTWVSGEVIADVHTLTLHDPTYSGPAGLIVGLYESATVIRVGTAQGQDHVALPEEIIVAADSQ